MSRTEIPDAGAGLRAFATDRSSQRLRGAFKAIWWGAAAATARLVARPGQPASQAKPFSPKADPAPEGFIRRAWLEAFEKDARDVALGLYPPMQDRPTDPLGAFLRLTDVLLDARKVEARRRQGGGTQVRGDTPTGKAYPAYYRQNFHFQTGGWFTDQSARRYDAQVETLFAGAGGAMRRRALSLLAKAWMTRDHRGLALVDLACGAGGFLADLAATFPRAQLTGLDLSYAYLQEAGRRAP